MARFVLGLALVFATCATLAAADDAGFSSPKATTKTLLTFLKDGQLNRVSECFVEPQDDQERNMLLYGLSDDAYIPAVHKALSARFGEKASPLGKMLASFDQQLQVIDSMEETTDGINGRLSVKGFDQGGVAFVNVNDQWKIALVPGFMLRSVPPQRVAAARAAQAAYLDTIKEIQQGRFASADEAVKALESRKRAASGKETTRR